MNESVFILACGLAMIANGRLQTSSDGVIHTCGVLLNVRTEALLTEEQAVQAAIDCGEYADGS